MAQNSLFSVVVAALAGLAGVVNAEAYELVPGSTTDLG
jgi:hypothetical protein